MLLPAAGEVQGKLELHNRNWSWVWNTAGTEFENLTYEMGISVVFEILQVRIPKT